MNIWVDKERLDDLYQCAVEKNSHALFTGIEFHVVDNETRDYLKEKLDEILCCIKKVYDPELLGLKQRARDYYQAWLRNKDIDKKAAREAYADYLEVKRKIVLLQDGDDKQ